MKKVKFLRAILLISLLIFIIFSPACKKKEAKKEETIKIGAILSLTGPVGDYGKRSLNGLLLGLKNINEGQNLLDKKIVVIVEDAKSDPKTAVSAYYKLTNINNIKIIIGDIYSSTTLAIAPLAEKDHVILLAPGASNPKIKEMGDYIFRNWTSDEYDAYVLAQYAYYKLKITKTSIIYQKIDYTVGLSEAFKKEFLKIGGKIVDIEAISTDAPEAKQVSLKVVNNNPECVYVCAEAKESAIVVKNLKEKNFKGQILANLTIESPEFNAIAGSYAENIIFSSPAFNPDDSSDNVKNFVAAYKKEYGEMPDVAAAHAYDAILIIAEAINKAKSIEPSRLKNSIYQIKNFPGVTGITTFDKYGDVLKDIMIKKISNGKIYKIELFKLQSEGE